MLESERKAKEERTLARDYIAQHAYMILVAICKLGGLDYNGESYIDLAYPEIKKKEPTADEIKRNIVQQLLR